MVSETDVRKGCSLEKIGNALFSAAAWKSNGAHIYARTIIETPEFLNPEQVMPEGFVLVNAHRSMDQGSSSVLHATVNFQATPAVDNCAEDARCKSIEVVKTSEKDEKAETNKEVS